MVRWLDTEAGDSAGAYPVGSLLVFDDVNRGFLSGGRAAANTGVLSYQLRLCVFAKPPVWRDKPTCSHAADFT